MSDVLFNENEDNVPFAFAMWQVFHNTITSMFKKLENEENNLRIFVNTILSSKEFVDTIIPKYDHLATKTEKQYEAFTTWLLGRLFYLLTCDKLEKSHNLFIEAQLKILDILQAFQPHIHLKMTKEYSNLLIKISDYIDNYSENDVSLKFNCFESESALINKEGLEFNSPIFEITTIECCYSMQKYLIKILTKTIRSVVLCGYMDKTIITILDNCIICLERAPIECKIDCIIFFTQLIEKISSDFSVTSELQYYYISFINITEKLVYVMNDFNIKDLNNFENALNKLFIALNNSEILLISNIRFSIKNICTHFISLSSTREATENLSNSIFLSLVCNVFRKILEYENSTFTNIKKLIDYKLNVHICTFGYTLIEYHIYKEIISFKDNFNNLNVLHVSPTWKIIHDNIYNKLDTYIQNKININLLNNFLNMLTQIFSMVRKLFFTLKEFCFQNKIDPVKIIFLDISELLIKLRKIKDNYSINANKDSLESLELLVKCFEFLFPTLQLSRSFITELEIIVYYICYPFIGDISFPYIDPNLNVSLQNLLPLNIKKNKQIETLQTLSIIMSECEIYEWKNFSCICQWIKNAFIFSVSKNDIDLSIQVAKFLPFLINSWKDTDLVKDILLPLLETQNIEVLKIITENFGLIICQTMGEISIVRKINCSEKIFFQIYCNFCDTDKKRSEEIFISVENCRPNIQDNHISTLLLKLFMSKDVQVKKNMAKLLPILAKHMQNFYTKEVNNQWLKLNMENDQEIRRIMAQVFAKTLQNMNDRENIDPDLKKELIKSSLNSLVDLMTNNFVKNKNLENLDIALDMLQEVGKLKIDKVLYLTCRLLILYLIYGNTHLSIRSYATIQEIAKSHNLTPNQIYTKYKKQYCLSIAGISSTIANNNNNICTIIKTVLAAFEFKSQEFFSREGHHIIPCFIPEFIKTPESRSILNDIAQLLLLEPSEILTNNFGNIYTHVYLNETTQIFNQSIKFIQDVTKTNVATLRKRNLQVIYNELLMHYHDKKDLVLKAIFELAKDSSEQSVISSRLNLQEIADNLNPRFLGVLVYFDSKLVSKRVCEEVKINVLSSLPEILKMMGPKYITPLRYKVLATLRTALTFNEDPYPELTCNIWDTFLRSCEPEALGPMLSVLFITLLPLMPSFPIKINSIFRYLIIENQEKVKENIPDLFFLTDTKVGNEFKNIVDRYTNLNRPSLFLNQINTYIKYITHENLEVRVYGLKFLKKILAQKRLELNELILGNNGMNETIVELIDILVNGCRDNDEKIKLACADCIGELGAIEPSHFPRKYTMTDTDFTFYITDSVFVMNALLELIRVFQMEEHTLNMNRYALAIQEILKVYGVSPEQGAQNYEIWNSFPENIKELMLPLLSSRYTICMTSDEKISVYPIYGSNLGSSFKDWLYNWTSHLISLIKNDKRSLLEVCKPSLKQDFKTLMFFLPYILIHAILDSTEAEKNLIYGEFIAVLTSNNEKKLDPALLQFRPLKNKNVIFWNVEQYSDNSQGKYMQVIFVLLDYLDRWLKEWESNSKPRQTPSPISNAHYQAINSFMGMFCKLVIAKCNYLREEYPRALLYLEKYVQEDKTRLNEQLGFFVKIYAELEEPDGVAGAMAMQQTEPSLEDMIVAHGVTGQLQDMAACYERMAQEQSLKPTYLHEMIKCYLELDNPFTAFNIAEGAIESHPNYKSMFFESQAECLWRLNSFDGLSDLVAKTELKNKTDWGVSIGKSLLHFRNGDRLNFNEEIHKTQKMLANLLTVTSIEEGVYRHGYSNIIKLHILNELQKTEEMIYNIKDILEKSTCEEAINNLMEEWDFRLKTIQASVRVFEPVLRLRRIILEQSQNILKSENINQILHQHIAKYWLKSAEIARTAGNFQQAYIYILQAERYKPKELFIEKAKLYWAKEEQELAFGTLKRGIEEHFPDALSFKEMNQSLRKTDRKLCAEAKLLIATYNDETANVGMEANINNYKEVVDIYKEWEKSLVCLAQYYDKLFSNMMGDDRDVKGGEILLHIINCFGKSLQYGSTYIYQSMPRMLSIWFEYGTRILESASTDDTNAKETKKKILCNMIKLMDAYLDRLPAYMFLSAFSQLVSRICHPVREVYIQIKAILIKLILRYPQQCMWMILAVSKSGYAMRTKRCQEILQDQRLKNSRIMRLIYDFNRLAEKLIELCNKPLSDGITTTSVNSIMRTLPRLLQGSDFSEIILPIQKLRKLILPNPEIQNSEHNPFPNVNIYIVGIEDEINVLQSLQRPRKITFRGSDGKKYIHMLKPKDDLRKDSRLMEFNDVVNLYLHRDAEARQKRLYIRTYSVVPLNEECGIVEWVDNLVPLRPVLMTMYKQKGLYVGARELKSMMCSIRDPLSKKKQVFQEKLLPKHPPVLSEWFRRKFPDAHHWYQARTAFIRTSAVMSMAGYILGLGDRHGENILLDSTNGDVVHVDFNCLFNKGENFDWPERVPFRLTHNMIEAMGPLGVEGIFRKTSAVTLRVLRSHTDTLMSIVRPFVYDPLVSWPRNAQPGKSEQSDAERTNEQAVEHIRNIELRLQGSYRARGKTYSVPLSCHGQANNLIAEATNVDNLCQMYIGWGPFL